MEKIVFEFNTYDPCVTNKIKFGRQHRVVFHVEDAVSIHVNPKINDKFKEYMKRSYGKHGEVKGNRGKVKKYLGMAFDFT